MQENLYDVVFADLMYDDGDSPDRKAREERAVSSFDALTKCINKFGAVDMEYMSSVSGIPIDKLITDLRGKAVFQDPECFFGLHSWDASVGWIIAPRYFSGNIRDKLQSAIHANKRFPGCFDENISALEKRLPPCAVLDEINASLGATWIPPEVYSRFIKDLLHLKKLPTVFYNDKISMWKVIVPYEPGIAVLNSYTYGTDHIPAVKIIEQTMNARTVKVYDYTTRRNSDGFERTLNKTATLAAMEKQRTVISEFDSWIRADEDRKRLVEEYYNDKFAGYSFSTYDGSFLELPGLNPEVTFYPHQKDAIARILLSGNNVLLAHDVGTGKTYEMISGIHELWRMGISEKNLIVVPNNILGATVDAHRYLYPQDEILAVFPENFTPAKRNAVLSRIKNENFIAVYMAYSSFDMVTMSKEYRVRKMEAELKDLRVAAANASFREETKLLKSKAEYLSRKLSKYILEQDIDPYISYDELGITTLVVDEAHNYKNIPLETKTDNIVGMHTSGSKKCGEMYEKCRFTERVIFATGTPLTNSLADLFVLQSYLQPEELRFREIDSFDMWVNCFGERETNFEIDVDSSSLRAITRFSTFHNLTELMGLFSSVCDFHQVGEDKSELPAFNGYTGICVPKSKAQTEYIKNLAKRTELIRAHKVKRTEDNLLKITTDGRKCALHIGLVGGESNRDEANKVTACADEIIKLYHLYPDTCQIVFSDIGTPKSCFNVYDSLCDALTERGISRKEIAFVHDAKTEKARAEVFKNINEGKLRVVIGSTAKLGVGVNVQERLVALHHLSVPWRPADMVQREGRIIRRGNTCPEVFIYRYITEGSFDSYSWQILENKQRFINSFLSGTATNRDTEDIADSVLSYAEVKALAIGDPLIRKRVETSNRLERTKIASRNRNKELLELRNIVFKTPQTLQKLRTNLSKAVADKKFYKQNKTPVPMSERIAFGEELLSALANNVLGKSELCFDTYRGFQVLLPANMLSDSPYVLLEAPSGRKYPVEMDIDKPLGCSKRLDWFLEHFDDRIKNLKAEIMDTVRREREARAELETGNVYTALTEMLVKELEEIDKQIEINREKE